jgi:hypothetical protein
VSLGQSTETDLHHVCSLPVVRGCGGECIWRVEDHEFDICILVKLVGTSKKLHFS